MAAEIAACHVMALFCQNRINGLDNIALLIDDVDDDDDDVVVSSDPLTRDGLFKSNFHPS